MKDLTNFRIIKFEYPFPTEELTVRIWDKMNETETKWAIQLTLKGINDAGDSPMGSWDILFLDDKLQEKIENILKKYDVPHKMVDNTNLLIDDLEYFSKEFLNKLDSYLGENLTIDDILDRILEVGYENITVFEKYYLGNNIEIKEKNEKSIRK
jgi:hypothetical protein